MGETKSIYLDHCATTPIRDEVLESMMPFLRDRFGNPSSSHAEGMRAREAVEKARQQVAALIGGLPAEIYFTSGGTEANNFAIQGLVQAGREQGDHIITSSIEHPSVLKTCEHVASQGCRVTYLPVNGYGLVELDEIEKAVTKETILITVMHANNEVGAIEPVQSIRKVVGSEKVLIHTDAVQTVGKIPVDVKELDVDLLSLSAHKFYGPKGVGALYIREGTPLVPLLYGGGQERGLRSGTENVAAIVGLGAACELALREMDDEKKRLTRLRDKLQDLILEKVPSAVINGHPQQRLPHVLNVSVPDLSGTDLVEEMDKQVVFISSGSACKSHRAETSHVLSALGVAPELAKSAVRFSLGRNLSEEDMDTAADAFARAIDRLKTLFELEQSLGFRRCF